MRKRFIALVTVIMVLLSAQTAFAAANPNVTIVNPVSGNTVYSDNLLVSVKLTTASAIKVSVTQESKVVNGEHTTLSLEDYQKIDKSEITSTALFEAESFVSTNTLSFYTKKVENIKPGIYKIKVDTVDAEGKALFTNTSAVEMKAKEESPPDPVSEEAQPSGPAQFLKSLLKIIFKE